MIAAPRKACGNTVTGERLKEAMADGQVMTDVSNAPSFDAEAPKLFDEALKGSLLAARSPARTMTSLRRAPEDVRCARLSHLEHDGGGISTA
ncbi:hypothetical protein M2171_003315 [Bradyrhizobium japonicum USDA 38]|uniref:hypothetical protein n=1 Tax=Bradyrhizobium japonicum TaxID=375 RepID=UPI0004819717|nr:hypothetical protein [Bradyrhizobium japonicum]MCS3894182.1 hypothetical protein [Bradyrhizobium japonicum USDA 38]MCS3946696.1 hypothetical protein [Bradyrhizobium japonicum]